MNIFDIPQSTFVCASFLTIAAALVPGNAARAAATPANVMTEMVFQSAKTYDDPFNQAQLDVVFIDPAGKELPVPAFWSGGKAWRARYASSTAGVHRYETHCSDES